MDDPSVILVGLAHSTSSSYLRAFFERGEWHVNVDWSRRRRPPPSTPRHQRLRA